MGILVEESNVQRVDTPVTILSSKSRCTMAHSSSDRAAAAAAATSTRGTFHDEYVLGHLIGQGAFGSVHKCWRRMDYQRQNPQEKQQQQQQLQQLKHPGGWEALPAVQEATGGPGLACKVVAKSRRGALASAQAEIAALQRLSSSRPGVNSQGSATSHGREEAQKLVAIARYPNAAAASAPHDGLGRCGTEDSLVGDKGQINFSDTKPTAMAARSGARLDDEARSGETLNSQRGQHHHPCVLRLVDWFEDDNHVYIVTNLCRGGDLLGLMMRRKQQLHLWQQRQQQQHQQLRGSGCEGGDEGRSGHGPCQGGGGEGLGDVLGGGLREDEARGVFAQLVLALALCHNMGLVHRDVKPGNIFVVDAFGETGKVKAVDNFQLSHRGRDGWSIGSSANGSVVASGSTAKGRDGGSRVVGGTCSALVTALGGRERDSSSSSCVSFPGSSSRGDEGGVGDSYTIAVHLGDFGLAKMMPHVGADGAPTAAAATPGQSAKSAAFKAVVGSPFYRPPEMVRRRPYGPAADMWSLGVVLAQMLTGTLPFLGSSLADMEGLASSIQAADVDFAAGRWAGVSEAARDVVRRLLCPVPEERMTAEEALQHPWVRGENKLLLPPEAWVEKRCLSSPESSSSSSSSISSSSSKTTTSNSKTLSSNSSSSNTSSSSSSRSSSSSKWDSEDCGVLSPKSRQHLCDLLQGSFSLSKCSPLPCALKQSRGFRAASMEAAFGGGSVAAMFAGTGSHRLSVK